MLYHTAIDGLVTVFVKTGTSAGTLYYIHKDHLGSITALTNTTGTIVEQYAYDPWGRRRNPQDWSFNNVTEPTLIHRGFTGHEHIDKMTLINMNGRIYDPVLGMFISCDNFVQSPTQSQNFNRYSYCMGNPLKYIDPSGYAWFSQFGDWLGSGGKQVLTTIVTIGVGVGVGALIVASGGTLAPLAIAAIAGASGGLAWGVLNTAFDGGSGKDYLINGGIGALVGGASAFVGGAVGQWAVKGLKSFAINRIVSPLLKSSLTGLVGGMAGGYGGGFVGGFIQSGGDLAVANKAGLKGLVTGGALGMASGAYTGYKQAKANYVDPLTGKYQFPENDGAVGEWSEKTLMPGERIDRYGRLEGEYFSPEGTPLENRSLHSFTNTDTYNSFEIMKPLTVRTSFVAPYYGQPGGGIQYITPYKTSVLLDQGYIKP